MFWLHCFILEKKLGTIRFAAWFFIQNFCINSVYSLVMILCYLSGVLGDYRVIYSCLFPVAGLWPIILTAMVVQSLEFPNQRSRFFFCPCEIKASYMHWIFLIVFLLQSINVFPVYLIAVLFGYLNVWGCMNWSLVSNEKSDKFEAGWMRGYESFITS